MRLDPCGLRGLEVLELTRIGIEGRPSLSQLLEILYVSGELRVLRLRTEAVAHDSAAEGHPPIELSQLTDLCLDYLQRDTVHDIIACLLIPSCRRLTILSRHKSTGAASPAVGFNSTTRQTELAVQSRLKSLRQSEISLDYEAAFINGSAGGMKLDVALLLLARFPSPALQAGSSLCSCRLLIYSQHHSCVLRSSDPR